MFSRNGFDNLLIFLLISSEFDEYITTINKIRKKYNIEGAPIYKDFEHIGITLGGFRNIAGGYSYIRKGTNNESKRSND